MNNAKLVRGSKESAVPFQVCVDTVYIRMNIEKVLPSENDDGMMGEQWQYYEIQYTLAEWLQLMTETIIDTNSFELDEELAEYETTEERYNGLPEQRPFSFKLRGA